MGQAAQLAEVVDALRTTAGVYTSTSDELNGTTLLLTGVVEGLLTNWKGASSAAFANACNRAWGDEKNINNSLTRVAAALTALAGTIENNVTAISSYETDSASASAASATIKPAELLAAQNASNAALTAIVAAVAEQASAIEAAAAEVGVCSVGEGGPWGENGLRNVNFASQEGKGQGGGSQKPVSQLIAKLLGWAIRGADQFFLKYPKLQTVLAALIGGLGNAYPSALTSGILSPSTIATFVTAGLGSLVGSYVLDSLAIALGGTVAQSATGITFLTLFGGIGMGSLTVFGLKPLVFNRIPFLSPKQSVPDEKLPDGATRSQVDNPDGSFSITDTYPNGNTFEIKYTSGGNVQETIRTTRTGSTITTTTTENGKTVTVTKPVPQKPAPAPTPSATSTPPSHTGVSSRF